MMQKIQRFGGAMITPVLLFAFNGIMLALSMAFQSQQREPFGVISGV